MESADLYEQVGRYLNSSEISRIICIGDEISSHRKLLPQQSTFFKNTEEFIIKTNFNTFKNQSILLKGARKFGFEKIAARLQKKIHQTVLEINLNSLVHNLNLFRSRLKPGTKIMAMVKALSYGSGSFEIAGILQYHHVDYLAVAYPDEGIALRENGIHLPIMVMNPPANEFDYIFQNNLEPEIYSFRVLNNLIRYLEKKNISKKINIHIKLETGMNRLGFTSTEIDSLIVSITGCPALHVASIFSHLTSSDNPPHDDFTRKQISEYEIMYEKISERIGYKPIKHILNSAGIIRFSEAQFDMVRLGLGLYGIDSTNTVNSELEQVSTLKTFISQIKNIGTGETVGYMRNWKATAPSKIATIEIGYADGLPRLLGNGKGKVFVNGRHVPVIGNICMDMTMIDVTGIEANEGDEVLIFGKENPVENLAKAALTIPYEILTNISGRVKRVYFKE